MGDSSLLAPERASAVREAAAVRCSWCQQLVRPSVEDHCPRTHVTYNRRSVTAAEFTSARQRADAEAKGAHSCAGGGRSAGTRGSQVAQQHDHRRLSGAPLSQTNPCLRGARFLPSFHPPFNTPLACGLKALREFHATPRAPSSY